MAVSRQKCPSCGGMLAYNRATRLWDCPYCGGSFKIQESQRGPYDIKNVAASVLLDAAKALFDQGQKDLAECEKLDPRHTATLAARMGLYHTILSAPAAAQGAALTAMYEQLKRDRDTLLAGGPAEQDDEEALYETLSADCLAVLLLTWHDLGLRDRAALLQQRLTPEQICQPPINQALFRHYLKLQDDESLGRVLSNAACLDRHEAALDLLAAPDSPRKAAHLGGLIGDGAFTPDDRPRLEAYLREAEDAPATKAALVCALCEAGLRPAVDCVVDCVLRPLDTAQAPALLDALCARRLYEDELRGLLQYGLQEAPLPVLDALLDAVAAGEQYVKLDARQLSGFLARTSLPAAQRLAVFARLRALRTENRAMEQVFQEYLLHTAEDCDARAEILDTLIDLPERFSPAVFEQYLLNCRLDSGYKAGIAQTLLDKGVNAGAIRGLLGRYMKQGPDPDPVRRDVLDVLLDAGLYLAPAELLDYACQAPDEPPEKLALLRRMVQNGACPPAGAAGCYLEVVPPQAFSAELLLALWQEGDPITDRALGRYLLVCPDAAKAAHTAALAGGSALPLGQQSCAAFHLGRRVEGNLLQLYLLCAQDDTATARALVDEMKAARARWNGDITVDGAPVRFKKYARQNREALSPLALTLCEESHVFSGLF